MSQCQGALLKERDLRSTFHRFLYLLQFSTGFQTVMCVATDASQACPQKALLSLCPVSLSASQTALELNKSTAEDLLCFY